jgi:hypothetical protein
MNKCAGRRLHGVGIPLATVLGISFAVPNYGVAQYAPGIYLSNEINTDLPTTTFGGGGPFEEGYGGDTPIVQSSATLAPIDHADSVTAYDAAGNGIYTVSASSAVNVLSVYKGQISVSDQASAGGDAPDIEQSSEAVANAEWNDILYVGGLPVGSEVTLRITEVVDGNMQLECPACASGGYNSVLYHGTQITDNQTGQSIGPDEYLNASGTINVRKNYLFKTYSGDSLYLADFVNAVVSGRGIWSGSANVNTAVLYVDPITPGAVVAGSLDVLYSTPTNFTPVPSVVSQTEILGEITLVNGGFTVGTISTVPSTTVQAGVVTGQVPAAGTQLVPLYPVNLIVSSGPPPAACAADASALVSVQPSTYKYNPKTKLYDQVVTIANNSSIVIKEPINLVVENLSPDATLSNSDGSTACAAPGSPYVSVLRDLAPGKTVEIHLQFGDSSHQSISWTPEVDAEGTP